MRNLRFAHKQENHTRRQVFERITQYAFPLNNKLVGLILLITTDYHNYFMDKSYVKNSIGMFGLIELIKSSQIKNYITFLSSLCLHTNTKETSKRTDGLYTMPLLNLGDRL